MRFPGLISYICVCEICDRLQLSNTLSSTLFPLGGYGEATPEEERIRKYDVYRNMYSNAKLEIKLKN